MTRGFEKISFEQFKKDVCDDIELHNEYKLPERATKNSCGYDLYAIREVVLHPGEIVKIPTGYKAKFNGNEMLMMVVRSSMGFKYNVRMCNQVGIVDADYYNNPSNEGHLWVVLQNEGKEDYVIEKGAAYCQGIFFNYLTCGETVDTVRVDGIGSTNK